MDVSSDLYDKNMYAYCDNNPIMRKDASGSSFKEIALSLSPIDYVSAAVSGAPAATGISTVESVVANAVLGGTIYLANCSYKGVDANVGELITSTAIGAISGRVGGSGVDGKNLRGVYKHSTQVLKTTQSAKNVAMYTAKQIAAKQTAVIGGLRTFVAGVVSNVTNFLRKIITGSAA